MVSLAANFKPRSANARREIPRLFLHVARKDPALLGQVVLKSVLA